MTVTRVRMGKAVKSDRPKSAREAARLARRQALLERCRTLVDLSAKAIPARDQLTQEGLQ